MTRPAAHPSPSESAPAQAAALAGGRPAVMAVARRGVGAHGLVLVVLGLLCLVAFLVALACGSERCAPSDLSALWTGLASAADPDTALASELLWRLRWPRAMTALSVGGLLALAGALLQVLLRNPLAEPYVLGVSGGASLAVLIGLWVGWSAAALYGAAWGGALLSTVLLFALAQRGLRSLDLRAGAQAPVRLLLTGVMLSSGWTALISLLLTLAPEARLRGMLFWLIGDIAGTAPWEPAALGLGVLLVLALTQARALNALLAGDARAQSLGVPVVRVRMVVCVLAAAATALAVATAGALGFVGLLVPHVMRRLTGNDQRWLLPACVLAGGATVLVADTLARTVVAPTQLPVGALMSLIGVPVFLWILQRRAGTSGP